MAEACETGDGTMAAIMGMEPEALVSVCIQASRGSDGHVEVANLNAPGQIVISGDRAAVDAASRLARPAGARRVMPINVGGAFHSRAMRPAGEAFAAYVKRADFRPPRVPIVLNQTASPTTDIEEIRRELVEQIWSPVRWVESLLAMHRRGVRRYVELGPGKVLSGTVKRTLDEAEVLHVQDVSSLRETLGALVSPDAAETVPQAIRQ
jgi:[acyl-carrier-protein] S-malonyltransferase